MSVPFFGAESRLTLDTVTATTADSGYPATNLYDDRTYVLYSATAASTVDIITDAGSGQSVSVDYCGIVNHNFYTKGATVTFAHSTNGSAYTTIFTVTPSDNTIILRWFTRVSDRYFRLRITYSSTKTIQIGEVKWGRAVTFPYGVEVGFDPQQEKIDAKVNLSQTGNFVGAVSPFITRNPTLSMKLLTDTFVRGTNPDQFGWFVTNYVEAIKPFFFNWTTDVAYEKDGFFGLVDPASQIKRTISTPLETGYRDIQMNLIGPKL